MKISIIRADSFVGVDGMFRSVDLTDLDATIHAIQFDTDASKGRIWFNADTDKGQAALLDFAEYQKYVDRWVAAAPIIPAPPAPIDQADLDNVQKQMKALALVMAQWNGKTVPQLKAAFRTAMDSLP